MDSGCNVSKMNKRWRGEKPWLGVLIAGMVLGAGAFVVISLLGHTHDFRNPWEPAWGLLVTTYEFFVLCGTGLALVSGWTFLVGGERVQALCRRFNALAALGIAIGLGLVAVELTLPTRLSIDSVLGPAFYKGLLLALFWFAATLGALFVLDVQLRRGRTAAVVAMGWGVFFLSCVGLHQMGEVFRQFGHPVKWHAGPAFIDYLIAAMLSGAALGTLVLFVGSKFSGLHPARDYSSLVKSLRKWSMSLLALYAVSLLVFFAGDIVQAGSRHDVASFLFTGPLAFNFWGLQLVAGLLFPMILLTTSRAARIDRAALAAGLILTGQFLRSYDMIIARQLETFHAESAFLVTHGLLAVRPCLPKSLVVVGAICFFLFTMTLREKMTPWQRRTR